MGECPPRYGEDRLPWICATAAALQVVAVPSELDADSAARLPELRNEYCLRIRGTVQARGAKQSIPSADRPGRALGEVGRNFECREDAVGLDDTLKGQCGITLPRFAGAPACSKNVILRDAVTSFFRDFSWEGFLEVETPGAYQEHRRDGRARVRRPVAPASGNFFTPFRSRLSSSKQLLMVAGIEKYFQIARCFRDEDQRGDRHARLHPAPDLRDVPGASEDVLRPIERMFIEMVKACARKAYPAGPVPRPHPCRGDDKYNSDKPDLRENKNAPQPARLCWVVDFPFADTTAKADGPSPTTRVLRPPTWDLLAIVERTERSSPRSSDYRA